MVDVPHNVQHTIAMKKQMLMGSDKYFKPQDVNLPPSQINSLAKKQFRLKQEIKQLEAEKLKYQQEVGRLKAMSRQ